MKKYDYLHYAALALLNHAAQCCAFILLLFIAAYNMTSSFSFASGYGLALGVLLAAVLSFAFGWGLRPKAPLAKNLCWNAAMALYALNLVCFLLSPEPMLGNNIPAWVWNFPITPALAGAERVLGEGTVYLFGGALICAVEPLCFTLGITRGAKAAAPDDTDNKETTPNA